jgi:Baseplate J-like protein
MTYHCCEDNRRAAVDAHPTLNGVDWLEVLDLDAPVGSPRQQTLMVKLLKPVPGGLLPENVRISGTERIRNIGIEWVGIADAPPAQASAEEQAYFSLLDDAEQILLIRTDSSGDFSTYQLQLVLSSVNDAPLPNFDPRLSAIEFSFKVECPSDFDCSPAVNCSEATIETPEINYLARDYNSLRRLVIDRLSTQMPRWRDRSPADLATTLAELIAYVGDLQHYQLDAVTTEAYLHTARKRSSLRRHALLVDYLMHDGSNARTWLHVEVSGGPFALPENLRFYTRTPGVPALITPDSPDERNSLQARPLVFEPMHQPTLRNEHNDFNFYTWGDERCCLPKGALKATLRDHWPDLATGDVLIFEEVLGPLTGEFADADPAHRHAVRLTEVRAFDGADPLVDPLDNTPITEIRWHSGDALPFALCLSSETDEEHGSAQIDNVSIALGNTVLVDHGRSIENENLGSVPEPALQYPAVVGDHCDRGVPQPVPPRFRPQLIHGPLTRQGTVLTSQLMGGVELNERVLFDPNDAACAALQWKPADAVAALKLSDGSDNWSVRRELLSSRSSDRHVVVESENDGHAFLRFGEVPHGRRPESATTFTANYRVGNGSDGNVGADSIAHAVTTEGRIDTVRNPLPAIGGVAAETVSELRRSAPQAFRRQERAVTREDYAEITERLDGVQRAAAGLRWTGSWHTVFTTIDRDNGEPVDDAFANTVARHLDRYRMAGHDLRVNNPQYVSLEIDLLLCVNKHYFRSDVREGLLNALGNGFRADGQHGLFHPDNFSFGQTVFLSPLYAAARSVAGVDSVQVTRFHRQGKDDPKPLADGFMKLNRLEIARLDNNRSFPEHGVLRLDLHGGK